MLENFAVDWQDGYYSAKKWETQMTPGGWQTQGFNKEIILVSQGSQKNQERQTYALASYLLINEGKAYFRYTHHLSYDQVWAYNNYLFDLGNPKGHLKIENPIWWREFEGGKVWVDPTRQQAGIEITPP